MSRIARRNVIPVNQITPLTYRDGVTYIQMLKELSDYVKSTLHPSLQHTVDQLVSDVEQQMGKHHDQYVDGVQEFQRIHDAFMSDVNAHLIALNDGAVSDLVEDDTSLLGQVLRDIFPDRSSFTELSDTIEYRVARIAKDQEEALKGFQSHLDTALEGVETQLENQNSVIDGQSSRLVVLESLFPEHYGATGDGTGDDLDALQQWADAGNTTLKPGSTYRVTGGIQYDRDHVSIIGNGATIHKPDGYDGYVISIRGNHASIDGVVIVGDGPSTNTTRSGGGVFIAGDYSRVKNNTIRDLHGDRQCIGVALSSRRGGHHVENNTIRNISATNQGQTDGVNGVSRGLYMNTQDRGLSARDMSMMSGNLIDGIYGLEGDGIQILLNQDEDQAAPRDNGYVTITNNVVDNCSRRCVKVQASYVSVHNNVLRDSRGEEKRFPQASLNVIIGSHVEIHNNDIDVGGHNSGISFAGVYVRPTHITILNNRVAAETHRRVTLIYVDRVTYSSIEHNTLIGGYRGIALGNGRVTSISFNTVHSGSTPQNQPNAVGIVASGNCDTVYMVGNVDMTWSSGHRAFDNRSTGGVTRNNVAVGR